MLTGISRTFSITVLTLFLAACGFQLRGSVTIPSELHQMSVNCAITLSKELCQTLTKQLELNGVDIVDQDQSDYTLSVTDLKSNRRTVSITGRAVAAEYQITNTASFNLIDAEDLVIIPKTSVAASQSYRNDENSVISKSREENQLKRELNKQLASKIVSRLSPYNKPRIEQIRSEYSAQQKSPTP